jgi:hypothetical protein
MADTGIFATTEEVKRKAGVGASTTSAVELYINDFMTQAESLINSTTRYNWSDDYTSLNVDVRGILKMAASAWAAVAVIRYDMSGYTSRQEALTLVNSLIYEYTTCLAQLKDIKVQDFMNGE